MVRIKYRYALCEVLKTSDRALPDETRVFNAIKDAVHDTHGDFGLGMLQTNLRVKYLNIDTNIFIIRAHRDLFHLLASALVFVRSIKMGYREPNLDVILKTLHVGGSIRACQKFLVRYHRRNMTLLFPHCVTEEQKAMVMTSIMDACEKLEKHYMGRRIEEVKPQTALDILTSGGKKEEDNSQSYEAVS